MATIKQMQDLIAEISGSIEVPGLDFDSVVEGMVENNPQYKTILDSAKTKEKRDEQKKIIVDSLKSTGRAEIEQNIAIIKSCYSTVTSGTTQLTESIIAMTASALIPSVITVPPGLPNPATILLENKEKKNNLLTICGQLLQSFLQMLQAAVKLSFPLPDSIITLLQVINTTKKTLEAIPV